MYETLLYSVDGPIATITFNRPDALNTIVPPMPDEVEAAVSAAVRDAQVKVIVVRGAGRAFCAGFDFSGGFHHWDDVINTNGAWDPGKDFVMATAPVCTEKVIRFDSVTNRDSVGGDVRTDPPVLGSSGHAIPVQVGA